MLSLARGLAVSPRVLTVDELSLGLAPKMVDSVFEVLTRAKNSGVTVILIEQYVHRALEFADRCLIVQRGASQWEGPAHAAGDAVLERYFGGAEETQNAQETQGV